MNNLLLVISVSALMLAGCETNSTETEVPVSNKIEAPSVILEAGEPVPSEEVVEAPVDEALYEFDEDGILICEEDEYGVCLDGDLQDIRAPQLKAKFYRDNAAYEEDTGETDAPVDYVEEYEAPSAEAEYNRPPVRIWARDMANEFTTYPAQAQKKYGNRKLVITGMVGEMYSNGVAISSVFVDVSSRDLYRNQTITVYCQGAYYALDWDTSVNGVNCSF